MVQSSTYPSSYLDASSLGRHHQHAGLDQHSTGLMAAGLPRARIGMDHHQPHMEAYPQDDIGLHHLHQDVRHLQGDMGIDPAFAIGILIPTGHAHIRGQDRGRRDRDLSPHVRVVVLHHVVAVDTEVGSYHPLQVEEGGGGVQATQAIPATVIEAVVVAKIEADIGGNIRLDVRKEPDKLKSIPHELRIS